MANATFGNHVGSGQCCLFERLQGMYHQQWDKRPKRGTAVYCSRHVVASSAGSISCAVDYSSLVPLSCSLPWNPDGSQCLWTAEWLPSVPLHIRMPWLDRHGVTTVSTRQCIASSVCSHRLQFCPDFTALITALLPHQPPLPYLQCTGPERELGSYPPVESVDHYFHHKCKDLCVMRISVQIIS